MADDSEPKSPDIGSEAKLLKTKSAIELDKKKSAGEVDVVSQQTERFNTPGTIWYAVKTGNWEDAMKFIKEDPSLLYDRGPVGETPIHLCFLFNQPAQLKIARDLIGQYPECITSIYETQLYRGETYLHITIVNRDLEMTRWLVSQKPELLEMPATGGFFQPGSPCYYGEYPLAFAASTNNIRVFEYLVSAGANLWQQDSNGNNVLHICVWHKLQNMYNFISSLEKSWIEKMPEAKRPKKTLHEQPNAKGLTPFLLAAYMGDTHGEMFDFILDQQKQNQWTYGPVSCNIYPLDQLDTLSGEDRTALGIIVKKRYLKLLMLPRIVDLLHKKWKAYAGAYFLRRCFSTIFYMFALTIAVILRDPGWFNFHDDNWKESYKGGDDTGNKVRGAFKAISLAIVLLGWMYKGFNEFTELWHSGIGYFKQAGAAFLENTLSFSYVLCIPVAIILELCGAYIASAFFVAIAVLFGWGYTLSLLLGFPLTGPFVIMVYKMIVTDVARYIIIYLVILMGYSSAFYAIADPKEWGKGEWDGMFYDCVVALFLCMLGDVDFDGMAETTRSEYVWLSSILLLSYVIVITILLLNLLIAMMGDTFNDVKDVSMEEWHMAYAQIIFSIESELGGDYFKPESGLFQPYWTSIGDKRYLQVQEVSETWYTDIVKQEQESAEEMLKKFDVNSDGVISFEEFQDGIARLRSEGKDLALRRGESRDPSQPQQQPLGPLGPQDALPGRLDDRFTRQKSEE